MLDVFFVLEIGAAILASLFMTGCAGRSNLNIQVIGFEPSDSIKIVQQNVPLESNMVFLIDKFFLAVQERKGSAFVAKIVHNNVIIHEIDIDLTEDEQTYQYDKATGKGMLI